MRPTTPPTPPPGGDLTGPPRDGSRAREQASPSLARWLDGRSHHVFTTTTPLALPTRAADLPGDHSDTGGVGRGRRPITYFAGVRAAWRRIDSPSSRASGGWSAHQLADRDAGRLARSRTVAAPGQEMPVAPPPGSTEATAGSTADGDLHYRALDARRTHRSLHAPLDAAVTPTSADGVASRLRRNDRRFPARWLPCRGGRGFVELRGAGQKAAARRGTGTGWRSRRRVDHRSRGHHRAAPAQLLGAQARRGARARVCLSRRSSLRGAGRPQGQLGSASPALPTLAGDRRRTRRATRHVLALTGGEFGPRIGGLCWPRHVPLNVTAGSAPSAGSSATTSTRLGS